MADLEELTTPQPLTEEVPIDTPEEFPEDVASHTPEVPLITEAPPTIFTRREEEFLQQFPDETQNLLRQNPEKLKNTMVVMGAQELITSEPEATQDFPSALVKAEERKVLDDAPPEDFRGIKDMARGALQIPTTIGVRIGSFLGSTVGWAALKSADAISEKFLGKDLVTQEDLDEMGRGLDRDTQDWLIRYTDIVDAPSTFAGTVVKEGGAMYATYVGLGLVAPVIYAGSALAGATTAAPKVAAGASAAQVATQAIWGWVRANAGKAFAADVIAGAPESMTETLAPLAKAWWYGETKEERQKIAHESAVSLAAYVDSLPMYKKVLLRGMESLGVAAAGDALLASPKAIKWLGENVAGPMVNKLTRVFGRDYKAALAQARMADDIVKNPAFDATGYLEDLSVLQQESAFKGVTPGAAVVPSVPEKKLAKVLEDTTESLSDKIWAQYGPDRQVVTEVTEGLPAGKAVVTEVTEGLPVTKGKKPKAAKPKKPKAPKPKTADETLAEVATIKVEDVSVPKTTSGAPPLPKKATERAKLRQESYGSWQNVTIGRHAEIVGIYDAVVADVLDVATKARPVAADIAAVKKAHKLTDATYDSIVAGHTGIIERAKAANKSKKALSINFKTGATTETLIGRTNAKEAARIIRMRNAKSGSIPVVGDGSFDDLLKLSMEVTNPAALLVGALVLDGADGTADMDWSTYVTLMACGAGYRVAGMGLRSLYTRALPATWDATKVTLAKGAVDTISGIKGMLNDTSTPEEWRTAMATSFSNDILSGVIPRAKTWLTGLMDRKFATLSAKPRSTFADVSKITSDSVLEFNLGVSRGVAEAVDASVFITPDTMSLSLSELVGHISGLNAGKRLTPDAISQVAERWTLFTQDYGIVGEAVESLTRRFGDSPEAKQNLMIALDSFEQYFSKTMAKGSLLDAPKMTDLGEFISNLFQYKAFRSMVSSGVNGVDERVLKNLDISEIADMMTILPDALVGKSGSKGLELWGREASDVYNRIKYLWTEGATLEGAQRQALMAGIEALDSKHFVARGAVNTLFNSCLSRPTLWVASAVGNALRQAQLLVDLKIQTYSSDDLVATGSKAALRGWSEAFTNGLSNTVNTLKTGRKAFDPTGAKAFYSPTVFAAASSLGPGADTGMLTRLMQYGLDAIGTTPSDIMKAMDVLPQVMTHGALVEREVAEMAYRNVAASGGALTMESAVALIKADSDKMAKIAIDKIEASRGAVFISSETTAQLVDGRITGGKDYAAKFIDYLGDIHRIPPVTAINLFFSTVANAVHSSGVNSVLGPMFDLMHGSKGLIWNKYINRKVYKGLSEATKRQYDAALTQMGTRAMAGTIMGGSVLGVMHAAGWRRISRAPNMDVELKNDGHKDGDWYNVDTQAIARMDQLENLNLSMALVDLLMVHENGYGDIRSVEQIGNLSLLLETAVAESGYTNIEKFIGSLKLGGGPGKTAEAIGDWFTKKFTRILTGFNPAMKRIAEDSYRGYRQTYIDSPSELMQEREPLLDQMGVPEKTGAIMSPQSPVWPSRPMAERTDTRRIMAKYGVDIGSQDDLEYGGIPVGNKKLSNAVKVARGKYLENPMRAARIVRGVESLEKKGAPPEVITEYVKKLWDAATSHAHSTHGRQLDKNLKRLRLQATGGDNQ